MKRAVLGCIAVASGTLASGVASADISRTEILDRAKAYVFYPWRAEADNLTASCDPDYETAYVAGDFMGVAYKWGGFDSLFQFSENLADGYGAGTTSYDEVFWCTAGVDCSGFVSRTWNTAQKYGTATFHTISSTIVASSLLPGDIFNDAGNHCAMYSHMLANGEPYMYESVYFNTHINATGGWSYVDGFKTRRFDGVTGETVAEPAGTLNNPIAVTGFPFADSQNTQSSPSDLLDGCAAQSGTNESGREYIYRVTIDQPGMLTVSVSDDAGADIDVHLYESWNTSDCTDRGDTTFTTAVDCGTYYVVADTFRSGSTEYAGNYDITMTLSPSGQSCGDGPPGYEPLGGPGEDCAYPDNSSLPFCNPTLGAEVCLYTTGPDSESFCSMPCQSASDCAAMPGGGCCEDIGDGELYCLTGELCPDQGGGDGGEDGDSGEDGDGGEDGGDGPGDGDGPGGGGPGSNPDGDEAGGCSAAGGPVGPLVPVLLMLVGLVRRRQCG